MERQSPPHRSRFLRKIWNVLKRNITYYVICRGNKVRYLRRLGVKVGVGCDLLNHVDHYGSEPWLIELGNHITLTEGVMLITHDASSRLFRHKLPGSSPYGNRFGTIVIHDECFIGVNAIILPGVSIGPRSIVGAGSVVTKDVPPDTVVAGVPSHTICTLNEYIQRYQEKMVPLTALDRHSLRRELTQKLWGEER
jgi:acetyltransferase-like isoleucine patch superfamily enzyme